jgi:hypothetical protein
MAAPLGSSNVPERCASCELDCACDEKQTAKTKSTSRAVRREMVFIFPPLPHAWELEGWPGDGKKSRGLRTSPVSWLGGNSGPGGAWDRRCGAFPRRRRGFETQRFAAVACAVFIPPYSRASATALHRLPEHEVRGDCEGRLGPTRGDDVLRHGLKPFGRSWFMSDLKVRPTKRHPKRDACYVPGSTLTRGRPDDVRSTESGV